MYMLITIGHMWMKENVPHWLIYLNAWSLPRWWNCLGRFRRSSLVGGDVSLRMGFERFQQPMAGPVSSLSLSIPSPHLQIMNQNVRKTARAIHLTHLLSLPMFNTSRMENMSWLRISSRCIHVLPDQAKVLNVTTSPFTTQLHYHVSQAPVSPRNSSWYPRQLPCHPHP